MQAKKSNSESPRLYHLSSVYLGLVSLSASAVLDFLVIRQRRATKVVGGKKWFYMPFSSETRWSLVQELPWLSRGAVHKAVTSLHRAGLIEIGYNMNKRSDDRTLHYHVPSGVVRDVRDRDRTLLFSPDDAKHVGLSAALVMNFMYREFATLRKNNPDVSSRIFISGYALAKRLPLTANTCRTALWLLVKKGYMDFYKSDIDESYGLCGQNPIADKITNNQCLEVVALPATDIELMSVTHLEHSPAIRQRQLVPVS